jgi:hypothetical protein
MTGYGDDESSSAKKNNSDENEQKRLESVLKNAEATWKRGLGQLNDIDESVLVGGKRKRGSQNQSKDAQVDDNEDGMMSLLSPELREQFAGIESLAILPSSSKKKNKKKELPPLTPAEIKAAKALYKNTQRKLAQLEQKKKQKELRTGLYKELQENALLVPAAEDSADGVAQEHTNSVAVTNNITPQEAQSLLLKSSELGKKLSKKQKLKHIRQKEALGLKLTQEEKDLLYVKYDAPDDDDFPPIADASSGINVESGDNGDESTAASGKKKKSKKKRKSAAATNDNDASYEAQHGKESEESVEAAPKKAKVKVAPKQSEDVTVDAKEREIADADSTKSPSKSEDVTDTAKTSTTSYAQMMLAGLSSLKSKTDIRNVELAEEKIRQQQEAEEEAIRLEEEEERKKRKVYVPSETIKVSTMHRIDAPVSEGKEPKNHRVQTVNRPKDVEESRYDLPVSAMEFEIIDAVRSNDCTILCGGKSVACEI